MQTHAEACPPDRNYTHMGTRSEGHKWRPVWFTYETGHFIHRSSHHIAIQSS